MRAFSLVELSIVLVILGLLTGGILAGQSLIRASEIRAVSTEYNKYMTAMYSFRDKYFALPGDMNNASKFWGARDGNDGYGADCRSETSAAGTCNGNGNGTIIMYDGVDPVASSYTFENYLTWDHLSKAGLIEGTYTGNAATGGSNTICVSTFGAIPGCNVPKSKLGTGMWNIIYYGRRSGDAYLFDGQYDHALMLTSGPGWVNPLGGLLTPEEAWNLDTKMDDGKPGLGKIVASRWNFCATGAASTADAGSAEYLLNPPSHLAGTRCVPVFRNLF